MGAAIQFAGADIARSINPAKGGLSYIGGLMFLIACAFVGFLQHKTMTAKKRQQSQANSQ
jgi:hypothetical protein